jgi:hypothetical protein
MAVSEAEDNAGMVALADACVASSLEGAQINSLSSIAASALDVGRVPSWTPLRFSTYMYYVQPLSWRNRDLEV